MDAEERRKRTTSAHCQSRVNADPGSDCDRWRDGWSDKGSPQLKSAVGKLAAMRFARRGESKTRKRSQLVAFDCCHGAQFDVRDERWTKRSSSKDIYGATAGKKGLRRRLHVYVLLGLCSSPPGNLRSLSRERERMREKEGTCVCVCQKEKERKRARERETFSSATSLTRRDSN